MNKKQPLYFGFGYFIAPFLLFCAFMIFAPFSPSKENIKSYLLNSREIEIRNPRSVTDNEGSFSHLVRYYLNFRKNRYKNYGVIFSDSLKKYFVLESYEGNMPNLYNFDDVDQLKCFVNNDEFNSSKYGSKENPIPVLWINQSLDTIDNESKVLYEKNVVEYIRFYKNRQKFNEGACAVCPY